jgi:hypothetical protein
MTSISPPPLRFTASDSAQAHKDWNATCGPHSLAAATGKTLEDVRTAMFSAAVNYRGWMSPTQVAKTLAQLGATESLTHHLKTQELCEGINRIQWEGKWLNPGVPARFAYFHTHWVAHFNGWVLCTACEHAEWIPASTWRYFHTKCDPVSPFHITHHYTLPTP